MITHSGSIEIARPPSVVFEYLTDPPKVQQWVAGLIESRALTPGELRVGSRSRQVLVQGPVRSEMEAEIIALEKDRRLEARITSSSIEARASYQLEDLGGRTRLTHRSETRLKGFLSLLGPLSRGAIERKIDEDLGSLKRLLEALLPPLPEV